METQVEKFLNYYNYYVSSTFLPDESNIIDFLEIFYEKGIKNIELGSNHIFCEDIYNYDFIKFNTLVHNHFPPSKNNLIINITSDDEYIRKSSVDFIKKSISFSKDISAKLYTFHPGFKSDPISTSNSKLNYDFIWEEKNDEFNNNLIKKLFKNSLDQIINHSKKIGQQIAIETEGSISKSKLLLMQNLDDVEKFKQDYYPDDIGINLNIGHLNLAKKKYNFDEIEFYNLINDYIVAFECSHNSSNEDEHLPLIENDWYWNILKMVENLKKPKILEYRNLSFDEVIDSIMLVQKQYE